MITVHMIGNAHLDPVWLWRWPAGVGEALATCRAACDLLDAEGDVVFTRGDAWLYERVEALDPGLLARIRAHVAAGRWAVIGGWYLQPDCNLPLAASFRKQMEIGLRHAREKLGVDVTVGYNVDTFGHSAALPRLLSAGGYDSYVMMRPMAHEKTLPASLFRWRTSGDPGPGVITWRLPLAYCTSADDLTDQVRAALACAVPGVDHVMCFYGVGDHGGGPTRRQTAWIRG
ncbi:MAG: alpha-mannosidase, partial [Spirochaetes bacterium]|nr:alpha-mannosidase [Spirochaetota bacterium]